MVRSHLPPARETTLRWTVDREDAVGSLSESQSTGQYCGAYDMTRRD